MIDAVIRWSLQNRLLVLLAAIVMIVWGGATVQRMPVDVFPDLTAPTVDEFRAAVERGEHGPDNPSTLHTLGKMQLVAFVAGMSDPALRDAIAVASP